MQFITTKSAQKYIKSCDKNTRKRLEKSIAKLPLGDLRVIFTMENEIIAIERARESILREGTVPFESIQWE
ncbi:MAG: hypothetical protein PUF12_03975 [Thermoflexaceae bacterium]|nr:hypothetical protein [Thermoflexaceae bacterium]